MSYSDAESDLDKTVAAPVASASTKYYTAADKETKDIGSKDFKGYGVAVGYTYPFSKRTNVYTYVSYNETQVKTEAEAKDTDVTTKFTEFGLGIKHTF